MSQVNLQLPVSSALKQKATKIAKEEGFSSLQEVIRLFLAKYAEKKIRLNFFSEETKKERAYKKYVKRIEKIADEAKADYEKGNYVTVNTEDELMKAMMVSDQNILYTPTSSDSEN